MGLDIYLYKCAMEGDSSRASFKSKGFNNALDAGKNQLQKKLRRSIKRVISALKKEKENGNDITELYKKKMRVLFKYFSYPEFYLSSFGVNVEWNGNKYEYTIEPNDNIFDEKVVNKVIEDTSHPYSKRDVPEEIEEIRWFRNRSYGRNSKFDMDPDDVNISVIKDILAGGVPDKGGEDEDDKRKPINKQ